MTGNTESTETTNDAESSENNRQDTMIINRVIMRAGRQKGIIAQNDTMLRAPPPDRHSAVRPSARRTARTNPMRSAIVNAECAAIV